MKSKIPRLSAFCLIGATAVCAGTLSADAGNVPAQFTGKPVCVDISQKYQRKAGKHAARDLNFMLFDASARNCITLMPLLLKDGASVTARDRFGSTALLIAARSGHVDAIKFLLSEGSDIEHVNLAGSSALLRAVTANRKKAARHLLNAGANPDKANIKKISPLVAASYNGSRRLVKQLLKAGANPSQTDASGKGPVVYAAGKGYTDILELLLDAKADVNEVYGNGLTALMWAAGHANDVPAAEGLATARLLIERGAKVDIADNRGKTALMIAAERNHPEIVELLLKAGANPMSQDKQGKTAAQLAASDAVRVILKN
jgi:ankyrin repeat protein